MRLSKKDFMNKYHYSLSTYHRRMALLKKTPIFKKAYTRVTSQEVWIDTELYDVFLSYLAYNRTRPRIITPEEFLKIK